MDQDTRLRVVERRVRTLAVLSAGLACVCAGTIAYTLAPYIGAQTAAPSIRASEVVIVDPKGVERVRIGGQLPDATPGKPRGQDVAGVLSKLVRNVPDLHSLRMSPVQDLAASAPTPGGPSETRGRLDAPR